MLTAPKPRPRNGHCAASTMAARDPPPRAFEMASLGIQIFPARWAHGAAFATPASRSCRVSRRAFAAFHIGRPEPFGEPVVDRLKKRLRRRETALIA